ncbi:MAG: DUF3025 domain-containing protein [Gammaproteobacteria bacterium]
MFPESKSKLKRTDNWDPHFYKHFEGYQTLLPYWASISDRFLNAWPTITDYNRLAEEAAFAFRFIEQDAHTPYESTIFHHQRIPTRLHNWHDFFNNVSWLIFPSMKRALIETAYQAADNKPKQRTSKQNVLAHFDECGMVICSDERCYLDKIRQHEWSSLFLDRNLEIHCYPIITGHGILEKGLQPYIGMTAKAILMEVNSAFFKLDKIEKLRYVDERIATEIVSPEFPNTPKALAPFPLLGWPKWHPDNDKDSFFGNIHYFRPKPKIIG